MSDRLGRRTVRNVTIITDLLLISMGFAFAYFARYEFQWLLPTTIIVPYSQYIGQQVLLTLLLVITFSQNRVWSRRRGDDMWDSRDFPSDLARPAAITASLDNALTGGDYLCRTVELAQIARQGRVTNPVGQLADVPPFLVPPGAPPLALASPQAQDIFDPNALPAPAAGPGAPVVTVPVPAAPTSGGGGGTLATPE